MAASVWAGKKITFWIRGKKPPSNKKLDHEEGQRGEENHKRGGGKNQIGAERS